MLFNNKDITDLGMPLEKAITTGDYEKAGWLLASTLAKNEGPVTDRKKEGLEAAAEFAQGFLKGAKVGKFETKDLAECISHEPKTEKMMAIAGREIHMAFNDHTEKGAQMGVKGLVEAAEAMAEMVKETKNTTKEDLDKESKPICAKLFFKERHNWRDGELFEKELFNADTTMKFAQGKIFFNHQDITALAKPLGQAIKEKEYERAGWLLAATLVKEEKAGDKNTHHGGDIVS